MRGHTGADFGDGAIWKNPGNEWRESAGVNLRSTDKIHFMVWDKDKVDHDLMGECITNPIGNLAKGQAITLRGCGQVDFLVFKITPR